MSDYKPKAGERVTATRTEYVEYDGYRFAILTLDNNDCHPATLGPISLDDFEAAVLGLDLSRVDAVAVTGMGAVFCAGADLKTMTDVVTSDQARDVAIRGLQALGRLEKLPVPTFAFINGVALGGGLELALHARHRVASESVRAIGFPEVRLGLVPGWGGIPRTAALSGPAVTARLVITDSLAGKNISAQEAAELGLVDAVLPDENFLTASFQYAAGVLAGTNSVPRRDADPHSGLVASQAEDALTRVQAELDARLKGAAPAPYRALELIAAAPTGNAGPTKGSDEEIRAFAELLLSDQARASIYAFHVIQSLGKKPAGRPAVEPLPMRVIGVVGAGLMASQLALVFAQQLRVPVRITDLSEDRVDGALHWIGVQLNKLVSRGRLDAASAADIRSLVTGGTEKAAFADCDVVIEAVFEELEVKRAVLAELEPLLRPDALLLTNTSSLSIEEMGAGLERQGRLIGFHFFNPVAVLPLVEIVRSKYTDDSTLSTAFELARRLGKTAVLTRDTPGFVVNRLLTRVFTEILSLLDDGADPGIVDHALDPLGLPMTPLQLLQFIGPAVQLHICETMYLTYPERFSISTSLRDLVAGGFPGYLDDEGHIAPYAASLLPAPVETDASDVRARILSALSEEVTVMLDENVVAGPEQIDLCMILGANYPFHTGGLTPLLDREAGTAFHPQLRVPLAASQQPTIRDLRVHS